MNVIPTVERSPEVRPDPYVTQAPVREWGRTRERPCQSTIAPGSERARLCGPYAKSECYAVDYDTARHLRTGRHVGDGQPDGEVLGEEGHTGCARTVEGREQRHSIESAGLSGRRSVQRPNRRCRQGTAT